jgi:hypothetical protein
LKSVAKEGLETALVGADMLEGEDLKTSVKSRTKKGASNLLRRAANKLPKRTRKIKYQKLKNQEGSGQFGYKRGQKNKNKRKQVGYGRKKYKRAAKPKKTNKKSDFWGYIK